MSLINEKTLATAKDFTRLPIVTIWLYAPDGPFIFVEEVGTDQVRASLHIPAIGGSTCESVSEDEFLVGAVIDCLLCHPRYLA